MASLLLERAPALQVVPSSCPAYPSAGAGIGLGVDVLLRPQQAPAAPLLLDHAWQALQRHVDGEQASSASASRSVGSSGSSALGSRGGGPVDRAAFEEECSTSSAVAVQVAAPLISLDLTQVGRADSCCTPLLP